MFVCFISGMYGESRCSPVRFPALDFEAVIAVGLRCMGVEWGTRVVCFS